MTLYYQMAAIAVAIAIGGAVALIRNKASTSQLLWGVVGAGMASALYAGLCAAATDAWNGNRTAWPNFVILAGTMGLFFFFILVPALAGATAAYALALSFKFAVWLKGTVKPT